MATSRTTRQDRRRLNTRSAILEAGVELFASRPVDAVSIDDITETADVAKGSFYNHFKDKDDLAREVTREVRREVEDRVSQANQGIDDPAVRVTQALCVFALFALELPQRASALLRLHSGATLPNSPSNHGVRADLESGLKSGRFSHVTVQTGLMAIIGTVQIALSRALDETAPKIVKSDLVDLAAFLLRGLGLTVAAAATAAAKGAATFEPSHNSRRTA